MRKRITSALLTLVMLLSLIPAMGTTAAAADSTEPSDPKCTITMTGVKAGAMAQDVTYKTVFKNGTEMLGEIYPPYMTEPSHRTPWVVKETGRWMQKNYVAYNGTMLAAYNNRFYSGMTYTLTIDPSNIHYKDPSVQPEDIKFVIDGGTATVDYSTVRKVKLQDDIGYAVDIKINGEPMVHALTVDQNIDHVYKRLESGIYKEINLTNNRKIEAPEGTKLKFTVDKDCVSDGGVLKFFKGFQTKIVNPVYREYSSDEKSFISGNLKVLSRSGQEIILQMGDRDTTISAVFTDEYPVRLNAIYLDVLPAIENGRQVTVVTPSG